MFPVDGWGSVKTETGYVIMRKEDGDIYKYKIVLKEGAVIRNGADIDHSDVSLFVVSSSNVYPTYILLLLNRLWAT